MVKLRSCAVADSSASQAAAVAGCTCRLCPMTVGASVSAALGHCLWTQQEGSLPQACHICMLHGLCEQQDRATRCTWSASAALRLQACSQQGNCAADSQGHIPCTQNAHRICSSRTCHATSCCVSLRDLRDTSRCELTCSTPLDTQQGGQLLTTV